MMNGCCKVILTIGIYVAYQNVDLIHLNVDDQKTKVIVFFFTVVKHTIREVLPLIMMTNIHLDLVNWFVNICQYALNSVSSNCSFATEKASFKYNILAVMQ